MKRLIPSHLRPAVLLVGVLLSAAVVLSDSRAVFGTSLVLLAAALLAFEGPTLAAAAKVEDDSV